MPAIADFDLRAPPERPSAVPYNSVPDALPLPMSKSPADAPSYEQAKNLSGHTPLMKHKVDVKP